MLEMVLFKILLLELLPESLLFIREQRLELLSFCLQDRVVLTLVEILKLLQWIIPGSLPSISLCPRLCKWCSPCESSNLTNERPNLLHLVLLLFLTAFLYFFDRFDYFDSL